MRFDQIVRRELGEWSDRRHPNANCTKIQLSAAPGPWRLLAELALQATAGSPYIYVRGHSPSFAAYDIRIFTFEPDSLPLAGPETCLEIWQLRSADPFLGVYHAPYSARPALVQFFSHLLLPKDGSSWHQAEGQDFKMWALSGLFSTRVEELFWKLGRPALYDRATGQDRVWYRDDLPVPPEN